MKRKKENTPREMWIKDDDERLIEIKRTYNTSNWNTIAAIFSEANPRGKKSGKQCRERYRNYISSKVKKKSLTKSEKILFILLHNHYNNRWSEIAKYYIGRNDINIKNFFYCYMRRVLKELRKNPRNAKITCLHWKTLEYYYILHLISLKYLLPLQNTDHNATSGQDKTIHDIVKQNKLNEANVMKYIMNLLKKLDDNKVKLNSPIILQIDSKKFKWNGARKKTLEDILKNQNFGQISSHIIIKIRDAQGNLYPPDSEIIFMKQPNIAQNWWPNLNYPRLRELSSPKERFQRSRTVPKERTPGRSFELAVDTPKDSCIISQVFGVEPCHPIFAPIQTHSFSYSTANPYVLPSRNQPEYFHISPTSLQLRVPSNIVNYRQLNSGLPLTTGKMSITREDRLSPKIEDEMAKGKSKEQEERNK